HPVATTTRNCAAAVPTERQWRPSQFQRKMTHCWAVTCLKIAQRQTYSIFSSLTADKRVNRHCFCSRSNSSMTAAWMRGKKPNETNLADDTAERCSDPGHGGRLGVRYSGFRIGAATGASAASRRSAGAGGARFDGDDDAVDG